MENISNHALYEDDCTRCPTCDEASWYIMNCKCGHVFCTKCGKGEETPFGNIKLKCNQCHATVTYYDY